MTERTTKTIKTPRGHEIVMKDYITGLEMETIRNFYMSEVKIDSVSQDGGKVKAGIANMSPSAALDTKKLTIETILISFDGKKNGEQIENGNTFNIVDAVLNLPNDEYQYVLDELNALMEPAKK